MSNEVYKLVEIVGTSPDSSDAAIHNALRTASKTIRHIRWFEVVESRGFVEKGDVAYFQVTLKIGFTIET